MSTVTGQAALAEASAAAPRRANVFQRTWNHRADYAYVLPALVVMLVVIGYPVYYTIELSFFRTPASLQLRDKIFIGFDNYGTILASASFWKVTVQTLIWTIASTFFAFLLGLGAALSLHREFAGRGLLRGLLLIPWVVSAVAASYVWKWLYHSDFGVIGAMAVQLGLSAEPINFVDNTTTVLPLADMRSNGASLSLPRRAPLPLLNETSSNYENQKAAYDEMAADPGFGSDPTDAFGRVWWDVAP